MALENIFIGHLLHQLGHGHAECLALYLTVFVVPYLEVVLHRLCIEEIIDGYIELVAPYCMVVYAEGNMLLFISCFVDHLGQFALEVAVVIDECGDQGEEQTDKYGPIDEIKEHQADVLPVDLEDNNRIDKVAHPDEQPEEHPGEQYVADCPRRFSPCDRPHCVLVGNLGNERDGCIPHAHRKQGSGKLVVFVQAEWFQQVQYQEHDECLQERVFPIACLQRIFSVEYCQHGDV